MGPPPLLFLPEVQESDSEVEKVEAGPHSLLSSGDSSSKSLYITEH